MDRGRDEEELVFRVSRLLAVRMNTFAISSGFDELHRRKPTSHMDAPTTHAHSQKRRSPEENACDDQGRRRRRSVCCQKMGNTRRGRV